MEFLLLIFFWFLNFPSCVSLKLILKRELCLFWNWWGFWKGWKGWLTGIWKGFCWIWEEQHSYKAGECVLDMFLKYQDICLDLCGCTERSTILVRLRCLVIFGVKFSAKNSIFQNCPTKRARMSSWKGNVEKSIF